MGLSDFPAAAPALIASCRRRLHTVDAVRAGGILPSSQHYCPVALLPMTPENPMQ